MGPALQSNRVYPRNERASGLLLWLAGKRSHTTTQIVQGQLDGFDILLLGGLLEPRSDGSDLGESVGRAGAFHVVAERANSIKIATSERRRNRHRMPAN